MSTIKDVANYADVSVATVSRVINGGTVSLKTKEKVINAARALDFSPNKVAKTLKTGKSFLIGAAVPDFSDSYFTALLQALNNNIKTAGYSLLVCADSHAVRLFIQQGCDAVVAMCTDCGLFTQEIETGIPIVFVDSVQSETTVSDMVSSLKKTETAEDTASVISSIILKRLSGDYNDFPCFTSGSGV